MKFYKEEKLFSLNEISTAANISRKEILELEKIGLILPKYKDQYTLYRYYEPLTILKIEEIKQFLLAGLSLLEIKYYYENKLDKKEYFYNLENKIDAINSVKLLFNDNQIKFYKSETQEIIYYYETRTINSFSKVPELIKNVYIHALNKDYMFASSAPFILFSKKNLNLKDNQEFRIKICLPLLKKYDEENIEILKASKTISLDTSSISFYESINLFNDLINKNKLKIKGPILRYFYYSNPSTNRLIAFLE